MARPPKSRRRRVLLYLLFFGGVYTAFCWHLAVIYRSPGSAVSALSPPFHEATIGGAPAFVSAPAQPRAVFIMCHGLGGNRESWTELSRKVHAAGYACILPVMPGHEDHSDRQVGFGPKEAKLVLECARHAKRRFAGVPVIGVGVSLGGASVWLAAEIEPQAFDAIATEAAFPSLGQASDSYLDAVFPLGHLALRPVKWFAQMQSGVSATAIRPIEGASRWTKPALVIHGDDDRLFPVDFGKELARASNAELWIVPGGKHANCYDAAPEEYERRLIALAKRAGAHRAPASSN